MLKMRRARKFLALSFVEKRLLITAVFFLYAIRFMLWIFPSKITSFFNPFPSVPSGRGETSPEFPRPRREAGGAGEALRDDSPLGGQGERTGVRVNSGRANLSPERIGWIVEAASMAVPMATCLAQSIVAKLLIERNCGHAFIKLGVARNESGNIEAHAWVESNGSVVIGKKGISRFVPLTAFDRGML
ncbi:MAG: lasso peptide biosynthesis B2 protein [Candidatus Omnitrophica bacterium]|nr:lasso peptide biosynthesis B2 protein [Candidatus Omnitrophota bacterium]